MSHKKNDDSLKVWTLSYVEIKKLTFTHSCISYYQKSIMFLMCQAIAIYNYKASIDGKRIWNCNKSVQARI